MWHYHQNSQKTGPISFEELKEKIEKGELSGSSLVWKTGTKDWVSVRDHNDLCAFVQDPPPLPFESPQPEMPPPITVSDPEPAPDLPIFSAPHTANTKRSFFVVVIDSLPALAFSLVLLGVIAAILIPSFVGSLQPGNKTSQGVNDWAAVVVIGALLLGIGALFLLQPKASIGLPSLAWKRLLAKMIDLSLVGLFVPFLALISGPENPNTALVLWFGGLLAGWFIMEIALMEIFGTTLGRKLCGIELKPISLYASLADRSMRLLVVGMGAGIPIVGGITQAIAYKRFRETGTTFWDRGCFTVTGKSVGASQTIIALLVLSLLWASSGAIGKSVGQKLALFDQAIAASEVAKQTETAPSPLNYDYVAARKAGVSDEQIVAYLNKEGYSNEQILDWLNKEGNLNFDLGAAKKAGYSSEEIMRGYLRERTTQAK